MIKRHKFLFGLEFIVDHEKQICTTVFPNGKTVIGIVTEGDDVTAKEHGYGDKLWDLNWHHEFLHTWWAQWRGYMYSPVLYWVAHDPNVHETEWTGKEEHEVLGLQKLINGLPAEHMEKRVDKEVIEELKQTLKILEP